MSDEWNYNTPHVKAIVGPRAHLKKAWREFNGMAEKESKDPHGSKGYDSDKDEFWEYVKESEEWKAMDKAIKNVVGDDDE